MYLDHSRNRLTVLTVFLVTLALCGGSVILAQGPVLPAVNLGNTSFVDAIAFPGGLVQTIGVGTHDDRNVDAAGTVQPQDPEVNSGAGVLQLAYISKRHFLGGWYGAETVLSAAYVDAGLHGQGDGFGDVTLGPVLQWPEKKLFGKPFFQRTVLDFSVPLGSYSIKAPVNIGSNAWNINPYYAFTILPSKRIETSWRIHYLWNGRNDRLPPSGIASSEQAGQAVHFNATTAYELWKGVYVGANGYYLRQLTDGRVNGISVPGTQQIGALGPGFLVHRGSYFFYLNAYREFGAIDMAEGNKVVVRLSRIF